MLQHSWQAILPGLWRTHHLHRRFLVWIQCGARSPSDDLPVIVIAIGQIVDSISVWSYGGHVERIRVTLRVRNRVARRRSQFDFAGLHQVNAKRKRPDIVEKRPLAAERAPMAWVLMRVRHRDRRL